MGIERKPARMSEKDWAAFVRQREALREFENDDEGTPEWRAMMERNINEDRARRGIPPVRDVTETETEGEFHERARALGLLL